MTYPVRTFDLPELTGLSKDQIAVHLALYEGYVTHTNLILDTIKKLREENAEGNAFQINELRRRLGFEFDGMRMHEYYFEQFEGGSKVASAEGNLRTAADEKYGNWDGFIAHIKEVAGTRGIGWTVVYFDTPNGGLHTAWVDDHQLGQFSGVPVLLALDMWEHSYVADYQPSGKKQYVEDFFANLNWGVIEKRFDEAMKMSAA